jgi:hypothetical protein
MPTTLGKLYLGSVLVASGETGGGTAADWIRPTDWPALPAVAATGQVFHGLHAVFDSESNFATIRCTGAFTVDWGDGSSPVNVASNTTAQYNYSYSASGLGAVTSRGYKTAIVTVTPQAGQTLSAIDLSLKHTQTGLINGRSSQWLDIRLAMNNAGTVTTWINSNWLHRLLEQFEWVGGSSTQTTYTNFLRDTPMLQSLPLFNTGAGSNFNNFLNNTGLRSVPLFNTAAGTSFSSFIGSNPFLRSLPLFNTSAGTSFVNFASSNASLQSVPLFDMRAGTNFSGCFNSNSALQALPALNMAAGTNISNIFLSSFSLSRIQVTFPAGQNINLANLSIGPAAANEIFTNLPTASGSPRTITMTGNWATTQGSYNPSIATAKGWTVTS